MRGEGWTSKIGPIQVEGEALLSFLQLNLLTVLLTKFLQQPKRGHSSLSTTNKMNTGSSVSNGGNGGGNSDNQTGGDLTLPQCTGHLLELNPLAEGGDLTHTV